MIIPRTIEEQIDKLSESIRVIDFSGDPSIHLYRNTIRSNIHEILDKTFPLLSKELDGENKEKIVDSFLLQHHAHEAEFHKIATELVCFIQKNNFLHTNLCSLVEYEWILYHIEITDTLCSTYIKKQYCPYEAPHMELRLNPTLKFIKLPFAIQDGIPVMNQSGDFIYALFKNSKNEIFRKRMFAFDLSILSCIVDKGIYVIADLEKLIADENKEYLYKWIVENITEEFIFLN